MLKPTEDVVTFRFNDPAMVVLDTFDVASDEEILAQNAIFNVSMEQAHRQCSEYTRSILRKIEKCFKHDRSYVFVDVKTQRIAKGDSPTELSGCQWHLDGVIKAPSVYTEMLLGPGEKHLLDVHASVTRSEAPRFFVCHTSNACATEFVAEPIDVEMPKCVRNFFEVNDYVTGQHPGMKTMKQEAGTVVQFESNSLHRGTFAVADTVRLWIRVSETNHQPVNRRYPINSTFRIPDSLRP